MDWPFLVFFKHDEHVGFINEQSLHQFVSLPNLFIFPFGVVTPRPSSIFSLPI